MNGHYLICPEEGSIEPAIYILLEQDERIIGICVNKAQAQDDEFTKNYPVDSVRNFLELNKGQNWYSDANDFPFHVLSGGHSSNELFVMYNSNIDESGKDHFSKMYRISKFSEIGELIEQGKITGPANVVRGYREFSRREIERKIQDSEWNLRFGLHAITYGPVLPIKAHYISSLREPRKTGEEIAGLDIGNFLGGLMHLMKDFQPSLMHVGVIGYLNQANPNASYSDNLKIVRMMVVIADSESNDIAKIMRTHTHAEIVEKYDRLIEGGFQFRLLEEFDQRYEMLSKLGFDPYWYDVITGQLFVSPNSGDDKQGMSGRAQDLGRTMRKLSEALKSKGVGLKRRNVRIVIRAIILFFPSSYIASYIAEYSKIYIFSASYVCSPPRSPPQTILCENVYSGLVA